MHRRLPNREELSDNQPNHSTALWEKGLENQSTSLISQTSRSEDQIDATTLDGRVVTTVAGSSSIFTEPLLPLLLKSWR